MNSEWDKDPLLRAVNRQHRRQLWRAGLVVAALLVLALALPMALMAGTVLYLEEPPHNSILSGIGNLRGWAVSTAPIESVRYSIDGVDLGQIPYGGTRHDVAAAYPGVPDAESSGFSMAFNYGKLGHGPHVLVVMAGDVTSESRFEVAAFEQPFVAGNPEVYGEKIWPCGFYGICLEAVWFPGETTQRDLELQWSTAAQQFVIVANEPHEPIVPPPNGCGFSPPDPSCHP